MSLDSDSAWGSPRSPEQMGHIIAARRRQLGLTQLELADTADVSRRFVVDLEAGHATTYVHRLFATVGALGLRLVLEPADDVADTEPPGITHLGW